MALGAGKPVQQGDAQMRAPWCHGIKTDTYTDQAGVGGVRNWERPLGRLSAAAKLGREGAHAGPGGRPVGTQVFPAGAAVAADARRGKSQGVFRQPTQGV